MDKKYAIETELLYRGTELLDTIVAPETPPIHHTTAYIIEDTEDYDFANSGGKYFYNRTANPNRDGLSEAISYLEHAEKTIVCSSGMGAISTTLLALLQSGDHILFSKAIYGETIELAEFMLKKYGIEISFADFTKMEEIQSGIQENTKIVYGEVIANPLTEVIDLTAIAKLTKEKNIIFIIDSTFTTPFAIRPLDFGVDIVLHSLTKYFGGHSDVTGGSISGNKEMIGKITLQSLLVGACMDPNTAWMLQRSIKTMSMRVLTQFENAQKVAEFLEASPVVKKVNYPGLQTHPQHELAMEMMQGRCGAMLSFRVEDDLSKVNAFIRKLGLIKYLGTLGGIRTSLAHPATAFKNEFTKEQLEEMGMFDGLIRLSIGAEHIDDIINDIKQALEVFR